MKTRDTSLIVVVLTECLVTGAVFAQETAVERYPGSQEIRADGEDAEIPEALRDAAFDQYIDSGSLRDAWASLDPAMLADAGLRLAEGERILFRSHKVASADVVLRMAVKSAALERDAQTLERLAGAVGKLGKQSLAAQISTARRLIDQPRGPQESATIDLNQVTESELTLYRHLMQRISAARLRDDADGLAAIGTELGMYDVLPQVMREQLRRSLSNAKGDQPDTTGNHLLLNKLAETSRFGNAMYIFHNTSSSTSFMLELLFSNAQRIQVTIAPLKLYTRPQGPGSPPLFTHWVQARVRTSVQPRRNADFLFYEGGGSVRRIKGKPGYWQVRAQSDETGLIYASGT